jgi:hypothetical protein
MSGTLYELTNQMKMLQEYIEQAENPEELAVLIKDSKEALELSIDDKLEGMMMIRQNKQARIDGLKAEAERLLVVADKEQKEIDRIERYAEQQLTELGHSHKENQKRVAGKFNFKFKKNPPKLEILDKDKIPAKYMNVPKTPAPAPDKAALLKLMKEKAEFLHGKKWTKEIDELVLEDFGIKMENNNQKFEIE